MKIVANDKGDTIDLSLDRVSAAVLLGIVEMLDLSSFDLTPEALDEMIDVQNAVYAELYKTSGV